MSDKSDSRQVVIDRMKVAGISDHCIKVFLHYLNKLDQEGSFLMPEATIEPVSSLPSLKDLQSFKEVGVEAMGEVLSIKLNGGLGTSMGLSSAKSLIEVKDGLCFLDLIARQVLHERKVFQAEIPLIFMNSFYTDHDTLSFLKLNYPDLLSGSKLPGSFIQNKVPRLDVQTMCPVSWPDNPELEWCPPGHGDIYPAIWERGIVQKALDLGIRYLFVSNSDNLGAVLCPELLGYLKSKRLPFMMEVARRTVSDRKGGHLAKSKAGQLLLRERAQCPAGELDLFEDIERHSYFNTNSVWINLEYLLDLLEKQGGMLDLPLIRNSKNVDPDNPNSPNVYQLETAMGAAIGVFDGAAAVEVPRDRFLPVKTTSDLLSLWSNRYQLVDGCYLQRSDKCTTEQIDVILDPAYFQSFSQFKERFPSGAPLLRDCSELKVKGNVYFGKDIECVGKVVIENEENEPMQLSDNTFLKSN